GIVQGPPPQVLLGCGVATQSVPGGDSSGGTQNAYKTTVSNCNGTAWPAHANFTEGGSLPSSVSFSRSTPTQPSATLGSANQPCMNPDFPTAVLDDGCPDGSPCTPSWRKGALFAVITQMAGADTVAVDNGGCFDVTGASCGQKGGVNSADDLSGKFGY